MKGRSFKDEAYDSYRFGFNGKENDTDFGNKQLVQDYGFRIYNPAIAKFLSIDPLSSKYPWYTPYQFAGNKPIRYVDLDGAEEGHLSLNSTDPNLQNLTASELEAFHVGEQQSLAMFLVGLADIFIFKGYLSTVLVANEVGSVVHSAEMQTHYRSQGNDEMADTFKSEGGAAATNLAIIGAGGLALGTAAKLIKPKVVISDAEVFNIANQETAKLILESTSKRQMPRMVTTIVDVETEGVFVGANMKRNVNSLSTTTRSRMPLVSKESWACQQCAEVGALEAAVKAKVKTGKNLKVVTNVVDKKTRTFKPRETCKNCDETMRRNNVLSNKKKKND